MFLSFLFFIFAIIYTFIDITLFFVNIGYIIEFFIVC